MNRLEDGVGTGENTRGGEEAENVCGVTRVFIVGYIRSAAVPPPQVLDGFGRLQRGMGV
jgi:hypothetical protein